MGELLLLKEANVGGMSPDIRETGDKRTVIEIVPHGFILCLTRALGFQLRHPCRTKLKINVLHDFTLFLQNWREN